MLLCPQENITCPQMFSRCSHLSSDPHYVEKHPRFAGFPPAMQLPQHSSPVAAQTAHTGTGGFVGGVGGVGAGGFVGGLGVTAHVNAQHTLPPLAQLELGFDSQLALLVAAQASAWSG